MNTVLQYIGKFIYFIKHYAVWLVLFFILISGSYIVFREFYYFGTLNLYISEENTTLIVDKKGEYECEKNFCSINISPGLYTIGIKKEGFTDIIYEIEIKRTESIELNIPLQKYEVSIEWGNEGNNNNSFSGVTFPLQKSQINKNIENISFNTKSVLYKNIPLYPIKNNISISSDEIGRNVWIVSDSSISGFSQEFKILFPAVSDSISSFYPQKDGSFSFMNVDKKYFFYKNKKQKPLDIDIESLFFACKIPRADNNENIWAYLQQTDQGIGLFIEDLDEINTDELSAKTIMKNLNFSDLKYLDCISSSKVKGTLQDGKVFWLDF